MAIISHHGTRFKEIFIRNTGIALDFLYTTARLFRARSCPPEIAVVGGLWVIAGLCGRREGERREEGRPALQLGTGDHADRVHADGAHARLSERRVTDGGKEGKRGDGGGGGVARAPRGGAHARRGK